MDPRSAAHALDQIADLLELRGEDRFRTAAYRNAARAVLDLDTDDLGPLLRSGALAELRGVGPATLGILRELIETGESAFLERLRAETPAGLVEMQRVPGLAASRIYQIYTTLGIDSIDELERAAADGRLATLPRLGPRSAAKIARGIQHLRATRGLMLFPAAATEAGRIRAMVARHPDVVDVDVAGSVRRRLEVVRDIDLVLTTLARPAEVVRAFADTPGVRDAMPGPPHTVAAASARLELVDGTVCDLVCVRPDHRASAVWRATGSEDHLRDVSVHAAARGITIERGELHDHQGARIPVADERALYAAVGLVYIEPELREGRGEVAAAARGALPVLIETGDVRGVLHCHTTYSDGKASIVDMAAAAAARGWSYLAITDHSRSAFYAGGLSPEDIARQHEEIDRVNATRPGVRVLKGIEADILPAGHLDYDEAVLDSFEIVVASVHSRFTLDRRAMTARILRALDDPRVTILGHPTGRLLLRRPPYAVDVEAVLEKAAAVGVAVELNADPHRLDLDWRWCQVAKRLGCTIAVGPDAHSTAGLDVMEIGIAIARKGWLEAAEVLNTGDVDRVLAFAARRRGSSAHRA